MQLPDLFKVRAFWESLSYLIAGLLGILFLLGLVPATWVIAPAVLLSLFLTVLKWFDIEPQIRFKALLREMETLVHSMNAERMAVTKEGKKSARR